jgi:hypothetical protein
MKVKAKPFMDGSPFRPLQSFRYRRKRHRVASLGHSPLLRVLEGLQDFGGHGYDSPFRRYWNEICARYGINPNSPASRKPQGSSTTKRGRGGRKSTIITTELLALCK